MYYEISNIVFNHKLSEHEIRHSNPFAKTIGRGKKKTRQNFFLVKDKPEKLFQFYKAGFCLKPHAFNFEKEQQPDCFVNCIVLDFDNLTKEQCEFVKSSSTYGDYSSGMKTKLKEIEGIPNAPLPAVWKYKVFFGVEKCLCTYEDVDAKFLEAVMFYNPERNQEEVKATWIAWKKANNRKNNVTGVFQTRFNGWILPDVAMLNSYRTQITYGVDVNQAEKSKVVEDDWIYRHFPTAGAGKFPTTDKSSYYGLDWKVEEAKPDRTKKDEPNENAIKSDMEALTKMASFNYDRFNLPMSKARLCVLLKKNHLDDVVLGGSSLKFMLVKIFGKQLDLTLSVDELMRDASLVGKSIARVLCETRKQGLTMFTRHHALEDCVKAFKEIHGQNVFQELDVRDKKNNTHRMEEVVRQIAKSFEVAALSFPRWRHEQRLAKTPMSQNVIAARDKWRDSGLEEDMIEFFKVRNKDIMERWEEAKTSEYNSPYDYHRRGFKAEVFKMLMDGEIKIETPEEFVDRMRMDIVPSSDGEYSDELLKKWHVQYKTMWNKEHPEDKLRKKHKQYKRYVQKRTSMKYDKMFKDMTLSDRKEWIESSDLHRQTKKRLLERYVYSEL